MVTEKQEEIYDDAEIEAGGAAMPDDWDELAEIKIPAGTHYARIEGIELKHTAGNNGKPVREQWEFAVVLEGNEDEEGTINGQKGKIRWWRPVLSDAPDSAKFMWLVLKRLAATFDVDLDPKNPDFGLFQDQVGEVRVKYEKDKETKEVSDFPTFEAPRLKG